MMAAEFRDSSSLAMKGANLRRLTPAEARCHLYSLITHSSQSRSIMTIAHANTLRMQRIVATRIGSIGASSTWMLNDGIIASLDARTIVSG